MTRAVTEETVKALYPGYSDGYSWCFHDYQPIIGFIGNVAHQVDDKDYQGDSRILFKDGDRWGVLIFGWGSCSGCDVLQACDSPAEVVKVIEDMVRDTKWFESTAAALDWFENRDWEGSYSWYQEETKRFVTEAKDILRAALTERRAA
ncbi:MAG: hypothetical protein B7Z15_17955 [Rhizobiales bacterium 32-66-8]|nr:MAG: hypothetical protein B7Z15_17955 [Rhizobiales bacterium 32-66-8]